MIGLMAITDSNPRQPYVDQHIYCLECKYDLFGLRTFTCPECGRPFDPADPKTWLKDLRHPFVVFLTSKRTRRIALWTGIPILLLAIIELGVDCGRHGRICVLCGARDSAWHFDFFGIGGDFRRNIIEGAVSRFIQKNDGVPCTHQWRFVSADRGGLFLGTRCLYDGISWSHFLTIDCHPEISQFLQEQAESDPAFFNEFKIAYRNPYGNNSDAFLEKLHEEATAWYLKQQDEKR